jgi:lauroyl/myristoyl acyltransferase
VTFEGLDRLPAAGSGRGTILALPHSGNGDLAGAALAELGYSITAPVRPGWPCSPARR